jgi:hypothetical protein
MWFSGLAMSQFNAGLGRVGHNRANATKVSDLMSPNIPATFLIVQPEVLIAQDIAMTLADLYPSARIVMVLTLADAQAAVKNIERLHTAFVAAAPHQFSASGLAAEIARRGGRAILLGHDAEMAGPTLEWGILYQPFGTEAVAALLGRPEQSLCVSPAEPPPHRQRR